MEFSPQYFQWILRGAVLTKVGETLCDALLLLTRITNVFVEGIV